MNARIDRTLWNAFLLPPVAALGAESLSYSLVHQSCLHQSKALLLGAKVLAAAACALAFAMARGVHIGLPSTGGTVATQRALFLAICGQVFGAFFFLVVLAMAIPDFLLRVCD